MDKKELNILYIEDNPGDFVLFLEKVRDSEEIKYNIINSETLAKGIETVCLGNFDLILLDLSLPDSKGLSTFERIKEAAEQIPVIIMTGNNDFELAKKAIHYGAQDFLVKGEADFKLISRAISYAVERKEMEIKLKNSEKLYRDIVELSPDAVCIHSKGEIIFANSAAIKMAGVKEKNELLGKSIYDFIHPDSYNKVAERVKLLTAGNYVEMIEEKFLKTDGSAFEVEVVAAPVVFNNKKAIQVVIRDITEKKNLELKTRLNEEKYKRLYENFTLGIFYSSIDGKLIDANLSLAKMLGFNSQNEILAFYTDLSSQLYCNPDQRAEIIKKLLDTDGWVFEEVKYYRKNREVIITNLSIRKQKNEKGEIEYLEGFIEDITEKKVALESSRLQSVLNAEMAELAGNLLKAKTINEITNITFEKAKQLTGSKFGYAAYIDPKTGFMVAPTLTIDFWDNCEVGNKNYIFEKFVGLWGWVLIHKKSLLTNNPEKDYRSTGTPKGHITIKRLISVPAMHDHHLIGQISLANADKDYTSDDLIVIERLASIFALGIRRVQAVNEVLESQEKFRLAFQYSNIGSIIVGLDKKLLRVNSTFCNMLGYKEEEILQKTFDDLTYPDDLKIGVDDVTQMINGEKDYTVIQKRYVHKNGRIIRAYVSSTLLRDSQNEPLYFVTHIQDFTEKIEADEKLKISLLEKEALIRELYHRTKNNMQVICSMIGLKALSSSDSQIINIFKEMENRIQTMALVHQKLYQSQNLSKIDLKDYVYDLTHQLFMSYNMSSEKISLNIDLDEITVLIDTAIPCGLFLNELISNAFKFAFPGDMKGDISISLKKLEDNSIELKVSDNGIGLQTDVETAGSETLGFKLLSNVADSQLQGILKFEVENGVSCSVVFKDEYYSERV